ncbi:hypothetical protein L1987_65071 [Smallanthus sonchifolius]|uniref:Uncharacterized protein n=1 Tax=Smallanthus sonchifolius TaxID=185202 RepID=A0ACB9BTN1_9ASTR|nr:hypothetical protein L1987_65071 [Smallanthus sonchifolius]
MLSSTDPSPPPVSASVRELSSLTLSLVLGFVWVWVFEVRRSSEGEAGTVKVMGPHLSSPTHFLPPSSQPLAPWTLLYPTVQILPLFLLTAHVILMPTTCSTKSLPEEVVQFQFEWVEFGVGPDAGWFEAAGRGDEIGDDSTTTHDRCYNCLWKKSLVAVCMYWAVSACSLYQPTVFAHFVCMAVERFTNLLGLL